MIILVALVDKDILHPIPPFVRPPVCAVREAYMFPPPARFLSLGTSIPVPVYTHVRANARSAYVLRDTRGRPRQEDRGTYN